MYCPKNNDIFSEQSLLYTTSYPVNQILIHTTGEE
jgi:hypothetical protein